MILLQTAVQTISTLETLLTPTNIMFVLGLLGILFTVWNKIRKPQEDTAIDKIVTEKDLGTKATILASKEAEGKALLLQQQVITEKEYNTKTFLGITERFNNTDHKIETLIETVNGMNLTLSKELMRIGTLVGAHLITSDNLFNKKDVA